jgi:hypothetical protein
MSKRSPKIATNPRYRGFTQEYFTAGDEEQFQKHRDYSDSQELELETLMSEMSLETGIWEGYHNISGEDVTNTFRYIFHKFKKGIYVRIKDNKLTTFLPFSKAKFTNEWGDRIKTEEPLVDFLRHVNDLDGRPFYEKSINKFTNGWYANNCLVRYEFPLSEGDTGTTHIHDLLAQLCENRTVPDIEFFINRRDFPLLKRDATEPYDHIWDDDKKPLVSHKYERYIPILSCVEHSQFADIAMPTIDDWARVRNPDGVKFPKSPENWNYDFSKPWAERKPTAVFRGSSTGIGVTIETNPRLKVAHLSKITKPDADGIPFLDAGITEWKVRPRKIKGEKFLKTIEVPELPFSKIGRLSPEEQANYKYIINIDGHVSAFRLTLEMNMGCVILLVESDYSLWCSKDLVEYVHYVPVKKDLSDLIDKIKWCKSHDKECEEMTKKCREYYKSRLGKDGIFDFMRDKLKSLKKAGGNYKYSKSPLLRQYEEELAWLGDNQKTTHLRPHYGFPEINVETHYPRFYNKFRAIEMTDFKNHLKFETHLSKTAISMVGECSVDTFRFAVKTTKDDGKIMENTHEASIGLNAVNRLLKSIPNFIYTFGTTLAGDLVSERVNGMTMSEWLTSKDFNFQDYVAILLQLSLALEVAQRECGFVHYDLFPWNIIIEKQSFPREFEYFVAPEQVIYVQTALVPIIIDYGKSHVFIDKTHYGFINMFKFSSVQDIMSIVLSSANILFKDNKMRKADENTLIDIVKCVSPDVDTYFHAKHACAECSFSRMISQEHGELEQITPLIFAEFLIKIDIRSTRYTTAKLVFNIGRPRMFLNSFYTETRSNCYRNPYSVPDLTNDAIKLLYFFRILINSFRQPVPKSIIKRRDKMMESAIWPKLERPQIQRQIKFDVETFHNKKKCQELYNLTIDIDSTILEYYDMLSLIMIYENDEIKAELRFRYESILGIEKTRLAKNIADRFSLEKF